MFTVNSSLSERDPNVCLSSRETCHQRLMSSLEPDTTDETVTDQTRPSFKDIFGVTESASGTEASTTAPGTTTTIRAPTVKTTVTRRPVTSQAWLPDGYSQIFRSYVFGPSGLKDYGSATLRCKI